MTWTPAPARATSKPRQNFSSIQSPISLPKAERDITLSTFVAQDIRDRRLLPFRFRLSGGQLRHTCRNPAYHVLDQKMSKFSFNASKHPQTRQLSWRLSSHRLDSSFRFVHFGLCIYLCLLNYYKCRLCRRLLTAVVQKVAG